MRASTRLTHLLLSMVLIALVALIAMEATGVGGGPLDPPLPPGSTDSVRLPGTPISGPTTISQPGVYYLTRNISVTGAVTPITIIASDVTLDLGGFTIDGDDTAGTYGILLHGTADRTRIRNGSIVDFNFGISAEQATEVTIDNLEVHSSFRGISLGPASRLLDCYVKGTTETAIFEPGDGSEVRDCRVSGGTTGIHLQGLANHVMGSTISSTNLGMLVSGRLNVVRDNTFPGNTNGDIDVTDDNNLFVDNVFSCVVVGSGIEIASGAGNVTTALDHNNVCP